MFLDTHPCLPGRGSQSSHKACPSLTPLPFRAPCAQTGNADEAWVASCQAGMGIQGPTLPSTPPVCAPGPEPFGQTWQVPLSSLICTLASETQVLGRIINIPFCGFWVILPIWSNNSHYVLWSFLIKMTFPFSLKVEISA